MIELNTIYNEDCLEGMKRIPDKSRLGFYVSTVQYEPSNTEREVL